MVFPAGPAGIGGVAGVTAVLRLRPICSVPTLLVPSIGPTVP